MNRHDTRNRCPHTHHSGYTLIELLLVTSMTLLIAGSACVLISKMLRASQVQATTLVRQRTLHLWESQFKQDGRLSRSAQIVDQPVENRSVTFQQLNRLVTYQVIAAGLERRVNGELGGRWECGRGEWEFSLIDGNRIVRAEFRQAEALSLSSSSPRDTATSNQPLWSRSCVDVALSSKPVAAKSAGDK